MEGTPHKETVERFIECRDLQVYEVGPLVCRYVRLALLILILLDIVLAHSIIGEENSIYLKDAWIDEIRYSLFA